MSICLSVCPMPEPKSRIKSCRKFTFLHFLIVTDCYLVTTCKIPVLMSVIVINNTPVNILAAIRHCR